MNKFLNKYSKFVLFPTSEFCIEKFSVKFSPTHAHHFNVNFHFVLLLSSSLQGHNMVPKPPREGKTRPGGAEKIHVIYYIFFHSILQLLAGKIGYLCHLNDSSFVTKRYISFSKPFHRATLTVVGQFVTLWLIVLGCF